MLVIIQVTMLVILGLIGYFGIKRLWESSKEAEIEAVLEKQKVLAKNAQLVDQINVEQYQNNKNKVDSTLSKIKE